MIYEVGISLESTSDEKKSDIAIIGMAGRFPGAKNIDAFWQNLRDGVESISFFSDEELLDKGVEPSLLNNPNYVKAAPILPDVEKFDAPFFGYSPSKAEMSDPQQRIFLECAWSALENAGYQPGRQYSIGVYGGEILSTYLLNNVNNNNGFYAGRLIDSKQAIDLLTGGSQASLIPMVAYKLDLTGPAINLPTYCSTSLVAVHIACQSLLNDECDLALAGGVSVMVPHNIGYLYRKGLMQSRDGHCRAFDREATGTHFGDGVGIVVLKKLERALADGDCIYAAIKGSAINNDGRSNKKSFYAPSINGQTSVITAAQKVAGIDPETINYIEAHGTATPVGDPIEVAALTQVFSSKTNKKGFCAIGSVKTNVGHLSAASGIAGLIKTVLALKYKQIPPSLHFKTPNPKIDFKNSPFYVNTKLAKWERNGSPRRAGVSSFGFGGTNAHVILEEWEPEERQRATGNGQQGKQLLLLSAKTPTALETATINLANHFKKNPELNLADVAYTLSVGRKGFDYRRIAVVSNLEDAANTLSYLDKKQILTNSGQIKTRSVVFMFSGQGSQYVNMTRELYETQTTFTKQIDKCCTLLQPHLGFNLRDILYPSEDQTETATEKLKQTAITQPALFVIEYALAQLWMSWGIKPAALIGHSIGEYVAATIAGIFSLKDALALVTARGKLMQSMPTGSMLAVPFPEEEVKTLIAETSLEIATINSPENCVVSGTTAAIEAFEKELAAKEIEVRRLHTSHAYHSSMMEGMLEPFTEKVKQVKLNPPTIPFISNLTGTWITAEQATNPNYYAQHLRSCVRFADGVKQLFNNPNPILLEVGPGRTLSTLVKRHPDKPKEQITLTSVRHPQEEGSDVSFLLKALGQLWLAGTEIDWDKYYGEEKHYRVPLPTYPFERKRYWIHPPKQQTKVLEISGEKKPDIADWFYEPSWKRLSLPSNHSKAIQSPVLVFADESGLSAELIKQLGSKTSEIIKVKFGEKSAKIDSNIYTINPNKPSDYKNLIKTLQVQEMTPKTIVHLWTVTDNPRTELTLKSTEAAQNLGFYSLLYLSQALGQQNLDHEIEIVVVSNGLQNVTGEEIISPEKATLIGPVRVITQEFSQCHCRSVDIVLPPSGSQEKVITQILKELQRKSKDKIIAYRGNFRWVETFEPVRLEKSSLEQLPFKQEGVYLITGGLGGIGLVFAEHLAKTVQAKLILIGRSALPERSAWEQWLTDHTEEDPTSSKMRKVQDLEALGAEVLVVGADVAVQEQMAGAISQAQKQFGQINGVIHAAGVPGGGAIQRKTREIAEKVLAPKVQGTVILETLLKDVPLDFMLLCSSIESALGHFGQVDYCGANNFLDACARAKSMDSHRLTLSINWDAWQQVGMAAKVLQEGNALIKSLEHGILPQEGAEAFNRILDNEMSQVLVSTSDIQSVLEQATLLTQKQLDDSSELSERPELSQAYEAPQSQIEQTIAQVWEQVLGVKNIGINDNLFDLGGDSLIAMVLVKKLQKELDCFLNVSALLEAPTIKQFSTYFRENYLKSIQGTIEKLNSEQIAWMRQHILSLHSGNSVRSDKSGQKNKPAIFILCPPRSGSTLLRVILAGHPQIFAPPELYLLSFNTLAERKAVFSEGNKFFPEGLIRAIMAIENCDGERAKQIMEELEEQNLSTKEFFSLMQEWLPGKIIVDKTPSYAFNPQVLQRAEEEFENPLYIHLLRHPLAMIRSVEQMRLDLLAGITGDSDDMKFSVKQKGELMCSIAHNNILKFLKNVPSSRQHRVKYEDLVQQPQSTVECLCQFIGIDFNADMLQPYKEKKQRMTDGIHSVSLTIGDPKFHTYESIDAEAADRWKENYQVDFLAEETWQVAEELGYERMTITDNNREEGKI